MQISEIFLIFEDDYSDVQKITLDQNYRSTQNILDAANSVISNNKGRMGKSLWASNGDGNKVTVYTGTNEYDEARYIARQIKKKHFDEQGWLLSDCAILYRTNAQSRVIEEMLMRGYLSRTKSFRDFDSMIVRKLRI